MGLPYLLGDKDPRDPVKGWDKTWAFLKELDTCIEYYPTGTGAMMKELGEGSRDMTVTMTGWDLNPRILGIVPKDVQGHAVQEHDVGERRALHGDARRASRRRSSRSCST